MEALDQSRHIVGEEALAEHDSHFSVASTCQYVSAVRHEQREAISGCWAQLGITQETHELEKKKTCEVHQGQEA